MDRTGSTLTRSNESIRIHCPSPLKGRPYLFSAGTFRHSFGTLLKANGRMSKPFRNCYDTREQQNNARRLHASCELEQAGCTEQGCKDDGLKRGNKSGERGHN
jgi:hypothetical protein